MLVLIVEDNLSHASLVRAALEGHGYDLLVAMDGKEAFKVMQTRRPELILMDVHLGDMDGIELTRWLRTEHLLQGTRIVAVTADGTEGVREKALAAGCDGFIAKPIDVMSLPHIVDDFLRDKPDLDHLGRPRDG